MNKKQLSKPKISIVVPVYNEASGLQVFHKSLVKVLESQDWDYEVIYVDDGSYDKSAHIIKELAAANHHIQPVYLSRNFGKEQATSAGLHNAIGDAALIIDSDGQHPVELIPEFVRKWRAGSQVVIGIRTANKKEGFIKKHGSRSFYKLLKVLGAPNVIPSSTDFRLVDREVIVAFNSLTEHNRVTRALIDWLGFNRDFIEFQANAREYGEATYSVNKLFKLALNGFVSLSFTPLYLSGYVGLLITFLAFLIGLFSVAEKYIFNDPLGLNLTGTSILAIFILFLVGILLIGQGLLAIYVARIYTEVQNRPLYIKKD